jgi:hypothetical protein
MIPAKPLLELDLRPIEAPSWATPGAQVFVLLPALDELLGCPGFGAADPICVDRRHSPNVLQALFAPYRARRLDLH